MRAARARLTEGVAGGHALNSNGAQDSKTPCAAINDRVLSSDRGLDRSIKITNGGLLHCGKGHFFRDIA